MQCQHAEVKTHRFILDPFGKGLLASTWLEPDEMGYGICIAMHVTLLELLVSIVAIVVPISAKPSDGVKLQRAARRRVYFNLGCRACNAADCAANRRAGTS